MCHDLAMIKLSPEFSLSKYANPPFIAALLGGHRLGLSCLGMYLKSSRLFHRILDAPVENGKG